MEIKIYKRSLSRVPFGTSVSLSTSESDAIAFLRFIRKTSSSLSLPLADSVRVESQVLHNHSHTITLILCVWKATLEINKLWATHTMEYYSIITKNELLIQVMIWMTLKRITISESKKAPLLCNFIYKTTFSKRQNYSDRRAGAVRGPRWGSVWLQKGQYEGVF